MSRRKRRKLLNLAYQRMTETWAADYKANPVQLAVDWAGLKATLKKEGLA